MRRLAYYKETLEGYFKRNVEMLETENLDLQLALAESEEKRIQSELDTQLAIAELAEVLVNG